MRWYKVLGLAAFAGVAATGAVIIRDQRRRRAYTPDEIRERLHARVAETPASRQPPPDSRP
jgi:lipid-binding SYLF domain-containing protein